MNIAFPSLPFPIAQGSAAVGNMKPMAIDKKQHYITLLVRPEKTYMITLVASGSLYPLTLGRSGTFQVVLVRFCLLL